MLRMADHCRGDLTESSDRLHDSDNLVCCVSEFARPTQCAHADLQEHTAIMHAKDDFKLSPITTEGYDDDRNNNEHKMSAIVPLDNALGIYQNIFATRTDVERPTWVAPPKRIYTCPDCHLSTRNAKCHLHHLASVHGRTFDIYECDACDYATRYKQKLTRHQRCHAKDRDTSIEPINGLSVEEDEPMPDEVMMANIDAKSMPTSHSKSSTENMQDSVNINSCAVWQVSPHVDEYADDRFSTESEPCGKKSPLESSSANRLTLKLSKLATKFDSEPELGKIDYHAVQPTEPRSSMYLQAALTTPHTISPNHLKSEPKVDQMRVSLQASPQYPATVEVTKRKVYSAVREAVDPAKYVIIHEIDGTKFACSRCGNIYKWRKSLNKHWKEKHDGETPPAMPVTTMAMNRGRTGGNGGGGRKGNALKDVYMGAAAVSGVSGGTKIDPGSRMTNEGLLNGGRVSKGAQNLVVPQVNRTEEPPRRRKDDEPIMWPAFHPVAEVLEPYMLLRSDILPPNAHSHHQYSPRATVPNFPVDLTKQSDFHVYRNEDDDDDEDASALDLSQSTGLKKASTADTQEPLQDKPLDFSVKYSPVVTPTHYPWEHLCRACEQSFQTAADLDKHYEQCHLVVRDTTNRRYVCHACSSAFPCKRLLADHFLQTHAQSTATTNTPDHKQDYLQCAQCAFVSTSSSELARHSLKHSINSRALTCRLCVFRAQTTQELSNHYAERHSPRTADTPPATQPTHGVVGDMTDDGTVIVIPQAPEDALMVSSTPTGSANHHRVTSAELLLPYKCSVCEYRARWPSEISQHMKNHSDEKPYHCPRCVYRSKWKWDVVKHLKRCGGGTVEDVIDTSKLQGEASATPPKCQNNNGNSASSAKRKLLSRGPPNVTVFTDEEGKPAQMFCDKCAFVGHSAAELRRHIRVHCEDKPFVCRTCGYCSKWKCDLKKHLRAYDHVPAAPLTYGGHGRKPANQSDTLYKCEYCDYTTHRLMQYEKHRRQHDSQLTCETCSYMATDIRTLLQHKRAHVITEATIAGREFQCKHCDWITTRSDLLSEHMRAVHAVMPSPGQVSVWAGPSGTAYGCERCGFTSRSRNAAQTHANWHGSGLAFTCHYCDYSRSSRHHVNVHMKLFHYNSYPKQPTVTTTQKLAYFVQRNGTGVRYRCTRCTWTTAHRKRMLRHTHARKHTCPTCARTCISSNLLAHHAARMHGMRAPTIRQCVLCPFTGNAAAMAVHSRQHGVKSRHACDMCDYSVRNITKLRQHRLVHNKIGNPASGLQQD